MLRSRSRAEAAVCLATHAVLGAALWAAWRGERSSADTDGSAERQDGALALLAFVLLAPLAVMMEAAAGGKLGALYKQRDAGSSGIALGALALPCALAGLVTKQLWEATAGHINMLLLACTAASAASLASLLWRLQHGKGAISLQQNGSKRRQGSSSRAGSTGSGSAAKPGSQPASWLPWALLAVVALVARAAVRSGGLPGAATVLAAAAAAAGCQHALLAGLPGVFTAGEALVAAEAAVLLLDSALQALQRAEGGLQQEAGRCARFVLLLTAGSVAAAGVLFPLLLWRQRAAAQAARGGQTGSSTRVATVAAAAVALLAAAGVVPAALWALRLALSSPRRLLVCGWWGGVLGAALPIMGWLSHSGRMRGILVRKGYHLLAVALFLPALLTERQLLGVALAAAFTLLLAVEAARLSGLPGIAPAIHRFMTSFTDARDSGPILITHFTLLLGMAAPIWLSNALDSGSSSSGGIGSSVSEAAELESQQPLWLAAYAGIMILGFGDTAASAVGSLFGRHRLCHGSSKTVEGTAAAVAATLAAWAALAVLGSAALGSAGAAAAGLAQLQQPGVWVRLAGATVLSCLLEGVTTQLDNVFMPLHYFALLLCL